MLLAASSQTTLDVMPHAETVQPQQHWQVFTKPHCGSPDFFIVSNDNVRHLVSSQLFTKVVRDEMERHAQPSPDISTIRQVHVPETSREIETVLLALVGSQQCQHEVYARIDLLDAHATVALMECFARYQCYGFEVRIASQLRECLCGDEAHLVDDRDWISSVYHTAASIGRDEICRLLFQIEPTRQGSTKRRGSLNDSFDDDGCHDDDGGNHVERGGKRLRR
ncbi:hypothetical protein ACQY0O_006262 [Thecaphora frezii]